MDTETSVLRHVETVVLMSGRLGQGAEKALTYGLLRVLTVSRDVDMFPQNENAKLQKSAAVTLVSLLRAKIGD